MEVLQNYELIVTSLTPATPASIFEKDIELFSRVSGRDIVFFTRSLSTLIDAGVPLVESIRALSEQTSNLKLSDILHELASDIEGGMTFSKALERHPKIFNEFFVAMVRSGEVSGNLQGTLVFLADYFEKEYDLRQKIRAALTYPAFVVGVFLIVGVIMMVWVMPQLAGVLTQITSLEKLPATSRWLIALSDLGPLFWLGVFAVILAGIGGLIYWVRQTEEGLRWWHRWQLKLPVFGELFSKIYQTRFAQNLSTLIKGGVPILEAINITSDVIGNKVYQDILSQLSEEVRGGGQMEKVLSGREEFSPILVQMISVGERSGKLEEVMRKIGDFFQKQVDNTVTNLTSLIEPILIVLLGIGVAILVASVIIPIYTVITSIGG